MAEVKQVGALLLVTGIGLAVWSWGDRQSDDQHEVAESISTVRLDSPNSDITVKVGDVQRTTVEEKRKYWLFQRDDGYQVDGDTLRIDGDCGWHCKADYVVTVPRGTKVVGDSGSGDISVAGVAGVDLRARSGEVELQDVSGDVKVDLTSGDVTVDRLTGKLEVQATSGDVEATAVKGGPVKVRSTSGDLRIDLAEATDVTAEGTSGDVEVIAPEGSYAVDTDTRSGEVDNGLGDAAAAEHTVRATTVSGDVELTAHRS
ncbi:hypothetical protein Kfla_6837 [Kribbella flavida DSM 17836]|uniref:DUF4097 domain-containing protein n=1 Tax=Kribbella flavida (strain DSM 17836 / JCM 10339 / NBRC 14399) TaxID=479435 RepID=D2Q2D2_KRIFD|nr:DUF4097 family beta strand repeat-containing protein [Kribbella flavida]ADB35828.1 hypothetical protein Kfla_6837 [Kribbella flavida DSM 17836]